MSKQYTRSEVVGLNCKEKTLLIIHDNVYDLTSFLNEHPGGEEVLLEHGGKDASEDFDDVGHSTDALNLMNKYKVGELVESEKNGSTPKQTWPSNYSKDGKNKPDQGISPLLWVGGLVVIMGIAYFVYL
ncbi:cytochrome b5-like [Bombus pascuorum]|uniref:cytochrome b5-like n=1 Tax=Bombus pascuorum TaxID=65598 RepID=UPI00212364CC|nr:cytochrome b5-like [Bombus pascuorum]